MPSDPMRLDDWERVEELTGDASPRRYSRLFGPGDLTAVLVEYPKPIRHELARDLEVFTWCRRRGIRVPAILAEDLEAGRAVLEDLGVDDAEATLQATPEADRRRLMEAMLEPLVRLTACAPDELPPWNPPLDRARLRWELAGCELWYLGHHRSRSPIPGVSRWLDGLAAEIAGHPVRVCHRDYHLNNLFRTAGGSIGVIDIQDILIGPDTYDIVSLVAERAATSLVGSDERNRILALWAEQTSAEPGWRERALAVQIQRGLKVLGSFARFVAAGHRRYEPWLTELVSSLRQPLDRAAAPSDVISFLLD